MPDKESPERAVAAFGQAIAILEQLNTSPDDDNARDLAVVYNNLGMTQDALGLLTKSEESFRKALEVLHAAVENHLMAPMDVSRLGGSTQQLGYGAGTSRTVGRCRC